MGTEVYTDGQGRRQTRKTSTGDDVAAAEAKEKMSSTKGAGLGDLAARIKAAKGSAATGPKSPLVEASERARKAADALASQKKR